MPAKAALGILAFNGRASSLGQVSSLFSSSLSFASVRFLASNAFSQYPFKIVSSKTTGKTMDFVQKAVPKRQS